MWPSRLTELSEATPSSESRALEGVVLEVLPESRIVAHGSREEPFRGVFCSVLPTQEITRTQLARIDALFSERVRPLAGKVLGHLRSVPDGKSTPATIIAACDEDPLVVRRVAAAWDRNLERSHVAVGTSLRLFGHETRPDGDVDWTPRGTTLVRTLEDGVHRFLRREGFVEVRDCKDHPQRVFDLRRRGARELPLRFFSTGLSQGIYQASPNLHDRGPKTEFQQFAFVRDDQINEEFDLWRDRVERFYTALELSTTLPELPRVEIPRGERLQARVRGFWGTPQHDGAFFLHRVYEDELHHFCHSRRGEKVEAFPIVMTLFRHVESLLASILETHADELPTWLTPEQVRIVPIKHTAASYADRVLAALRRRDVRATVDRREERWENKVRQPVSDRIPYFLVLGDREVEGDSVDVRTYREPRKSEILRLGDFVDRVAIEASPAI